MNEEKKEFIQNPSDENPVSRRDFIATGLNATLGYGLMGLYPLVGNAGTGDTGPAQKSDRSGEPLSTPAHELREYYDILIIGSGYGGSILSARLSGLGQSVCLLERGREWHPGDFPTSETQLIKSLRTANGPMGVDNPLGLFEIAAEAGSNLDIIAGCGLGGTSLINAAIAIQPEPLVFEQKEWPSEIRAAAEKPLNEEGSLWNYFQKAERMLKPATDPQADSIQKVKVFKKTLRDLGLPPENLRLNVTHTAPAEGINEFGVKQSSCIRCGDCCSGCNTGAKNTLATNYLPYAKQRGAKIFTAMEVTKVEKTSRGYTVHYVYHGKEAVPKAGKLQTRTLILSAGSMGSTEILLRSQAEMKLSLSSHLGTRLSANGDVLGFSYNGRQRTDVVDYGNSLASNHSKSSRAGQAIVAVGKYRGNKDDLNTHFLLLDGPVPSILSDKIAKALATFASPHTNQELFKSREGAAAFWRASQDLITPYPKTLADKGALNYSMVLLACGHDSSGGKYEYNKENRPKAVWPDLTKEVSFKNIQEQMKKIAENQGAYFIPNPRMNVFGKHLQATHPLGGCPMGDSVDQGVVNHVGQVFDANGDIHDGLFVADAAIIPRSLGATPLMTISALSERIADFIIERQISD